MSTIKGIHRKPYKAKQDLQSRLVALHKRIGTIRDLSLPLDIKKRMLNHAVWEVTKASGDFAPEFRSRGVLQGALGTKIQREHVFKRKAIVEDILVKAIPLRNILERVVHCVVTQEEHARLGKISKTEDGWTRYQTAGIDVCSCVSEHPEKRPHVAALYAKS